MSRVTVNPYRDKIQSLQTSLWDIGGKNWLDNYSSSQVLFYRRYVDDTFCLFNNEEDALMFSDYINARHPSIRFTMEREIDKKLPFLDILLDNSHPSIVTSVYRKKTFTGLLTNYFSFAPLNYKLGLIRTLVDRVYKINNSWVGFHLDVEGAQSRRFADFWSKLC